MYIDDNIVNLSSFRSLDRELFETIENQFIDSIEKIKTVNEREILIELYKQKIICLNSINYYRKILIDIKEKDRELMEYSKEIFQASIDFLFKNIYYFLDNKKYSILKDIEKEFVWYQGVKDAFNKSAQVINVSKRIINTALDKVNIKSSINFEDIDSRALLEKLFEKHMSKESIVDFLDKSIQETFIFIINEWNKKISRQINSIYSKDNIIVDRLGNLKISFEMDSTGQIFLTGMSSAVIGTLGLAAGWHTLTYALLNVFPPIAIFTAVATIASGIYNKEKAKEKLIKQVEDMFNEYRKQIIYLIDEERFSKLNNMSIYDYFQFLSILISEEYKSKIKGLYINIECKSINDIIGAYEEHIMIIDNIIEEKYYK